LKTAARKAVFLLFRTTKKYFLFFIFVCEKYFLPLPKI